MGDVTVEYIVQLDSYEFVLEDGKVHFRGMIHEDPNDPDKIIIPYVFVHPELTKQIEAHLKQEYPTVREGQGSVKFFDDHADIEFEFEYDE